MSRLPVPADQRLPLAPSRCRCGQFIREDNLDAHRCPWVAAFCSIPECGERHSCHGWCNKHYKRWCRSGDPLPAPRLAVAPLWRLSGCTGSREGYHGHPDETAALARRLGMATRTVRRWNREGLSELQADRAACALNMHPSAIWSEWS